VINPVVRLARGPGLPVRGDALLETTGRRSGLSRRTLVCGGLDGKKIFWLIAQRGRAAHWVRNIEANPRVRVKVSGANAGWRTGTAHILDDDPRANPLPIRIDLDSE
jgi:deazaflavin-dependent oxidoreductase (nitroreductase family)